VGFLSVVGTKLRAEMFAVGCPPRFKITVAEPEWLITKPAASRTTVQVPAVRDHESPPSSEDTSHLAVFRESPSRINNMTPPDGGIAQMKNHSSVAFQHHNSARFDRICVFGYGKIRNRAVASAPAALYVA